MGHAIIRSKKSFVDLLTLLIIVFHAVQNVRDTQFIKLRLVSSGWRIKFVPVGVIADSCLDFVDGLSFHPIAFIDPSCIGHVLAEVFVFVSREVFHSKSKDLLMGF